jgi:hypothetical protein
MEEIAKSLIDTGATGLIVIVAMLFFTSLMKRQNGAKEDSLIAEFRDIKPLIQSIGKHMASMDDGLREYYRTGVRMESKLDAMGKQVEQSHTRVGERLDVVGKQLDRIETK